MDICQIWSRDCSARSLALTGLQGPKDKGLGLNKELFWAVTRLGGRRRRKRRRSSELTMVILPRWGIPRLGKLTRWISTKWWACLGGRIPTGQCSLVYCSLRLLLVPIDLLCSSSIVSPPSMHRSNVNCVAIVWGGDCLEICLGAHLSCSWTSFSKQPNIYSPQQI